VKLQLSVVKHSNEVGVAKMKRHSKLVLAVVGSMAFLSNAAFSQQPTIRIAWNKTWDVLPIIIAENNGYWKSRGLDVKYTEISGSPQGVEVIHSGGADAASVSPVTLITAREKGFAISGIAALNGKSDPAQNTYLASPAIKSVKDLKGKKIGISNYGGDFEITLAALLKANGLDVKKDVTTVIVPLGAIPTAIANGQIDAGSSIPTLTTIALKQYPDKVRLLAGTNDIPQIQTLQNFQTLVLVMGNKFLSEQRPTATKFAQGFLEAIKFIKANPKKSLEIWADFSGNKIVAEWAAPPDYPPDGQITAGGIAFEATHLLELGYIKAPVNTETLIDRALLAEASR
jgi:NitT/TauT family transport system substrate-binding protein